MVRENDCLLEPEHEFNISYVIDDLEKEFDSFVKDRDVEYINELRTLRLIKVFIYKRRKIVQSITSRSILSGFDCATLSIITYFLAHRKGYDVKLGRPRKFTKLLHFFVIKKHGGIFKVAGRDRKYQPVEVTVKDAFLRLKFINLFTK